MYRIASSPIAGSGCFATAAIPAGTLITIMSGKECSFDEMVEIVNSGDTAQSDSFGIEDDTYIQLNEGPRTFNHSCDPNAYVRGKNELVSMRAIAIGEEICYDYSATMNDNEARILSIGANLWTCPCSCGASNCRGVIDQFRTLPAARKAFFVENRFLQDYMLRHFG